jgi:hypothetical protein
LSLVPSQIVFADRRPSETRGGGFAAFGHPIGHLANVCHDGLQPAQFDEALIFVTIDIAYQVFVTAAGDNLLDQLKSSGCAIIKAPP